MCLAHVFQDFALPTDLRHDLDCGGTRTGRDLTQKWGHATILIGRPLVPRIRKPKVTDKARYPGEPRNHRPLVELRSRPRLHEHTGRVPTLPGQNLMRTMY